MCKNTVTTLDNEGWLAELELHFSRSNSKTFLSQRKYIGPLTVQRPFYPEDGVCHLYILHPPGGVVGGDELSIKVNADPHSNALITAPSATKIYRTLKDKYSLVAQNIVVKKGATLEWLPMETIVFPGASSKFSTTFSLFGDAKIMAWEIQCLGRPVMNERFDSGTLKFNFELYKEGVPVIIDTLQINEFDLDNIAGLRGFPIFGAFIISAVHSDILDHVRTLIPTSDSYIAAATQLDDFVVIRCLGLKTHVVQELFSNIWIRLRYLVIGKKGIMPRIWLT